MGDTRAIPFITWHIHCNHVPNCVDSSRMLPALGEVPAPQYPSPPIHATACWQSEQGVQIYAGKIYDTQLVHPLNTTTAATTKTTTPHAVRQANKLNAPAPQAAAAPLLMPWCGHCRVEEGKKALRKIGFTLI